MGEGGHAWGAALVFIHPAEEGREGWRRQRYARVDPISTDI